MDNDALYIVLAEDDEDDRLFFKEALQEIKVKTVIDFVNDGSQLMDYLNQPGIRLPHVVFLDLNMPIKSGMECLVEIRRNSRLKDLAIVIYSTSSSEEDIEDAFVNGANIYIKKPNDFSLLKSTLAKVVSLNWQYHTLGLKKENFLLSINNLKDEEESKP
ncbi:MAG TPA: response regulator [Prolixibacteraceae bacterium]|jgi:CheY-like chemotaxis protein|nr:response regulator [Prolixibacteraceae bacterium]